MSLYKVEVYRESSGFHPYQSLKNWLGDRLGHVRCNLTNNTLWGEKLVIFKTDTELWIRTSESFFEGLTPEVATTLIIEILQRKYQKTPNRAKLLPKVRSVMGQ